MATNSYLEGMFPGAFQQPQKAANPYHKGTWEYNIEEMGLADPIKKGLRMAPGYQGAMGDGGVLDPKYMLQGGESLLPEFMERIDPINLNKEGLEAIRGRATGEGMSSWGELMLEANEMQRQKAMDDLAQQSGAGISSAYSDIAQRGGLSRGASERIATKGANELMLGRQGVGRDSMLKDLGIRTEDESQKLDLLKALPGMEAQAMKAELGKESLWADMARGEREYKTGVDQFNLGNLFKEMASKRDFEAGRWGTLMEAMSNERTAQAQENSGKK